MLTVGGGFRALTDQDVVGTYEASADWGRSTLVLRPDHSFDQTAVRNDHTQASTKGTWRLDPWAGKNASHGILVLKLPSHVALSNCLAIGNPSRKLR
jgi:hypothetical protein